MELTRSDSWVQQTKPFVDSYLLKLVEIMNQVNQAINQSKAAQVLRDIGNPFPAPADSIRSENADKIRTVARMVKTLPDHQFKNVVRLLVEGAVSGQLDEEQLADAMQNYSYARQNNDVCNLPEMTENDTLILAAMPTYHARMYKAMRQFNRELARRFDLSVEFINSNVVLSSRSCPSTRIVVAKDGTLSAYQGRAGHRAEYRSLSMECALSILKR